MSDAPLIHLQNGHLQVTLRQRGAALVGVRLAGHGQNLVLGFADPSDHDRIPVYAGALVGPIANRLEKGQLTIDGTRYQMALNEKGVTTLHSGPDGLHAQDWQVGAQDAAAAALTCALPDGHGGLPGNRQITARYALDQSTLTVAITATTDATTPMNIAAHPYWCLDGKGAVRTHRLHLHTRQYLPTGEDNLPLGAVQDAAGTLFDFTIPRAVPHDPALDVNYCLPPGTTVRPVATLTGATGVRLDLSTNAPGLQVYNGAHLPDLPKVQTDQRDLRPFGAIALEPQHWPNAPHTPGSPSILLEPGQTYHQISRYHITRT